jgi:hypothetical protein
MKKIVVMWFVFNAIAVIGAYTSVQLSPDTLFEFPFLHLLGIFSLFFIINLPFYTAYERLQEEE